MDPILAEMFNTNGYAEKVAEIEDNVEMLLKVAEDEGVDLSGLDDDEIVDLANELATETDYVDDADVGYDPDYYEGPNNLGPKTAEADFLGRYMAHAMHQEQEKIAGKEGWFRSGAKKIHEKVLSMGEKLHKRKTFSDLGTSAAKAKKDALIKRMRDQGMTSKQIRRVERKKGEEIGRAMMEAGSKAQRRSAAMRGYGAIGGGAALLGAGGAGTAYALKKKSHIEHLNDAAIDYANHLLELSQYEDISFDKVASVQETYEDGLVAELAWGMLEDEGYVG